MTTHNNKTQRIRTLYAIFIGIIAICLGLFFCDVLKNEDPLFASKQEVQQSGSGIKGFAITNLHSDEDLYCKSTLVDSTANGVLAKAHVSRFDTEFYVLGSDEPYNAKTRWAMALQVLAGLITLAVVVIAIGTLMSLYRNAKQGKVFQRKNIKWIRLIGYLIIIMSLAMDLGIYLERCVALDLLQGTIWAPKVQFTIHFARIFFGMLIVFVAELFHVGFTMEEEQELTI